MPLFLSQRDTESREHMDDSNCDLEELHNTYRQFDRVNQWISGWRKIYTHHIRPKIQLNIPYSLLDVGFGGGDIPIKLARWAQADGIDLRITAIDPDPRAIAFVESTNYPPNIQFLQCQLSALDPTDEQFDFVVSNHLIHHLTKKELLETLDQAQQLSRLAVIFNDLQRSDLAHLLFNIFSRPIFRSSFITEDGLTSIKRSYTPAELETIAPKEWQVQRLFPFRMLLSYAHG
ncbi:MAG: class I SAM-dependent methyltransferase [Bacteroidota bacterium]